MSALANWYDSAAACGLLPGTPGRPRQRPADEGRFWERIHREPANTDLLLEYAAYLRRYSRLNEARRWEAYAGRQGGPSRDRTAGFFTCGRYEAGGDLLGACVAPNLVPTAGLNHLLSVTLAAGTQVTAWYSGLVGNSGFSGFAAGDTAASHAGWTESVAYTEANRQTWTPGAVSGGVVSNSSSMSFSINATVTIQGALLASSNTKGGTSGTLFAEGAFAAAQSLVNGQSLKITYTATASSS